jgi:hypothetical protein
MYRLTPTDLERCISVRLALDITASSHRRANAAFAIPALYNTLEAEGYFYAIRLPTNAVLQQRIVHESGGK